jgi:hypothetical protein
MQLLYQRIKSTAVTDLAIEKLHHCYEKRALGRRFPTAAPVA